MDRDVQDIILKLWACMLQLFGLTFAVSLDAYIDQKKRRRLLEIIVLVTCLVVLDFCQGEGTPDIMRNIFGIVGYSIRPAILALFILIVDDFKFSWIYWIPVGLNGILYWTALIPNVVITFRVEDGHFYRGLLGYSAFVISFAYLGYLMFSTFRQFRKLQNLEALIPIFCSILIVIAVLLDVFWGGTKDLSFLTTTTVGCCIFYYIWLHLQFVREHERALKAEQRIRIMVSQIQPHFLYNTLSTIQALCITNPEKAADITQQFGVYLRQNIDSLDKEDLIPFEKEMEHTKIYAEIEQVRFPSISIHYDLKDRDFSLPALSVQPLVENAIRHGVRIRKEGIINIKSYKEEGFHIVEIEDNGKGFVPDFDKPLKPDETGRSHIGLRNVKERIENICHGTFEVDSVPDVGTKIIMRIPVKEEKK